MSTPQQAPAAPSPEQGTFTPYHSDSLSLDAFLTHMLSSIDGIKIDPDSLTFIGAERAASSFGPLSLGDGVNFAQSGLLLTSGDGAPARVNTHESYSVNNQADWQDANGEPSANTGDDRLTAIAQEAFGGAGSTHDAAILAFDFSVTDPGIQSISFDLAFGSEEFPAFIDSSFVDIAEISVNGKNYAYMDGDVEKPLSIVGATTEDGRFIDNTRAEGAASDTPLSIEYNGMTPRLTISIPLDETQTHYSVRLGIADTGDHVYDSGLFLSNFQTLTSDYEGTLVNVEADDSGSDLTAPAPGTATKFVGGKGNDTMQGSTAADVYDIQQGGANTIKGKLEQLDSDTVLGFTEQDSLEVEDATFSLNELSVTMGSAILAIDADNNGHTDGSLKLEGDFRKGSFVVESQTNGTGIHYQPLGTTPEHSRWVATEETDIAITQTGITRLLGDTAGKTVTLAEGSQAVNVAAGTHVVLEGKNSDDVQLLRDGTTLLLLDHDGEVLVQMAAAGTGEPQGSLALADATYTLQADTAAEALALESDGWQALLLENDGDRLTANQWEALPVEADPAALTGVADTPADTVLF